MVRLQVLVLTLAGLLLSASPASAGRYMFGPLPPAADAVESHSADTVYWNKLPAKADGQLRYVSLRGSVVWGGGTQHMRFVVLRPQADGTVKVAQVEPRQHGMAINGDPTYRNPYKSPNWELCVRKGDYLGIWKHGHGQLQVFGQAPGSVVEWYENAAGIARGNVFATTPSPDRALLMEVTIETGDQAYDHCPGGYENHVYRGLDFRSSPARLPSGTSVARLRVRCPHSTYGGCFGRLVMNARVGGHRRTIGSVPFSFGSGRGGTLRVPLSAAVAALVHRRGSLETKVLTKGHDDPSDARNRRAPGRRPGRQSAQTQDDVVLRSQ